MRALSSLSHKTSPYIGAGAAGRRHVRRSTFRPHRRQFRFGALRYKRQQPLRARAVGCALRGLLNEQADFQIFAEATTGQEAIGFYREKQPEVVIMDLRLIA